MHKSPSTKDERIDIRITADTKDLFAKAAKLSGLNLSAFVVESTRTRATSILEEHNRVILNNKARDLFLSALSRPSAANASLKKAARTYKS